MLDSPDLDIEYPGGVAPKKSSLLIAVKAYESTNLNIQLVRACLPVVGLVLTEKCLSRRFQQTDGFLGTVPSPLYLSVHSFSAILNSRVVLLLGRNFVYIFFTHRFVQSLRHSMLESLVLGHA